MKDVLKELRESAGMTHKQLAAAAGLSEAFLRKIEAGAHEKVKRSTAVAIYLGASGKTQIPEPVRVAFFRVTGIPESYAADKKLSNIGAAVRRSDLAIRGHEMRLFTDALPDEERRSVWWLFDLIDQLGAVRVEKMIQGLALMNDSYLTPAETFERVRPQSARTIDVLGKPIQKPGYIEQTITHYEVPDGSGPSAASTRKKRGTG